MKLYHGTTSHRLKDFEESGWKVSDLLYLASDLEAAESYANMRAEEDEDEFELYDEVQPVILVFDADKLAQTGELGPDWDDAMSAFKSGQYSEHPAQWDWQTSLKRLGTLSYTGPLKPALISIIQDSEAFLKENKEEQNLSPKKVSSIENKIKALRLYGWAGECGWAAIQINKKVFGGEGTYIAGLNNYWLNRGRFIGHVAVKFKDKLWDSDGIIEHEEDLLSWGMVDPEDPDYFGPGWTEKDAYEADLYEMSEEELIQQFDICTINENTMKPSPLKILVDNLIKEELKEFFPMAAAAATAGIKRQRGSSQPVRSSSSYEYKEPVRGDYITTASNAVGGRLQGGKEVTAAIEPVVDDLILLFYQQKNKRQRRTGGNPLGRDMSDQHEIMWSGDEPEEKHINEVRRPDFKSGKGLKFTRYGGLTPRKQKNLSAPVKRGLWAFVYPYFDWWFLSGDFSGIEGRFKKTGEINKNLLKHFYYDGPIYSKINVPGSTKHDGWFLTTTEELGKFLPKQYAQDLKFTRKEVGHEPQNVAVAKNVYKHGNISVDHYEVFIPGKGFKQKK